MSIEEIAARLHSAQFACDTHIKCIFHGEITDINFCNACNKKVSILEIARYSDVTNYYYHDVDFLHKRVLELEDLNSKLELSKHELTSQKIIELEMELNELKNYIQSYY